MNFYNNLALNLLFSPMFYTFSAVICLASEKNILRYIKLFKHLKLFLPGYFHSFLDTCTLIFDLLPSSLP